MHFKNYISNANKADSMLKGWMRYKNGPGLHIHEKIIIHYGNVK